MRKLHLISIICIITMLLSCKAGEDAIPEVIVKTYELKYTVAKSDPATGKAYTSQGANFNKTVVSGCSENQTTCTVKNDVSVDYTNTLIAREGDSFTVSASDPTYGLLLTVYINNVEVGISRNSAGVAGSFAMITGYIKNGSFSKTK